MIFQRFVLAEPAGKVEELVSIINPCRFLVAFVVEVETGVCLLAVRLVVVAWLVASHRGASSDSAMASVKAVLVLIVESVVLAVTFDFVVTACCAGSVEKNDGVRAVG